MTHVKKVVPLSKILLDFENSRHGELATQEQIFEWMTSGRIRPKVLRLASEISKMGLSPIEVPALIPVVVDGKSRYVVVEGNRRVAALKLLQNPSKCPDEKTSKQYLRLKESAVAEIPARLECVIFPSLSDSEYWIELRHGGERDGAGIVNWGAKEFVGFARRMGRPSPNESSVTLLEYALSEDLIDQDTHDAIPVTNLTRILGTTDVRNLIGIHMTKGRLSRVSNKSYFDRAIADVLAALARPDVTVKQLKDKEQRVSFVRDIKEKEEWGNYNLEPSSPLSDGASVGAGNAAGSSDGKVASDPLSRPSRGATKASTERKRVVPPSLNIKIENNRLRDIFVELKRLDAQYINAASILTRVFLEGCTDVYLATHDIQYGFNDKLSAKAVKVRQHLLDANKDSKTIKGDLKGYEMLSGAPNSVGSSDTLNCSVHNMSFCLTPLDLKLHWNNLQSGMKWFEGSI